MREQILEYLQNMANRIKNTRECAPLSFQIDKLLACMNMAKELLDADDVVIGGDWVVRIKGGKQ